MTTLARDKADEDDTLDFMADIIAMNDDHPVPDGVNKHAHAGLSSASVAALNNIWRHFESYIDQRRSRGTLDLIPGCPRNASDIVDPNGPDLDYATCEAFLDWHSSGVTGHKSVTNPEGLPRLNTVKQTWNRFIWV